MTGYARDGYQFPIDVMTAAEAHALRAEIEAIEARYAAGGLPRSLDQYFRVNAHYVLPQAARLAAHPAVLDAVSAVLGPDLLAWSCELFIKEPHTPKHVSWHQDLTYWGLDADDGLVTAWLALSPATRDSGCMRFVAGSHRRLIAPHRDSFEADNLLSRGQEIAVEVDESEAIDVVLAPGQMSLHHGRMFHASGPNVSDDRRIGVAIRYLVPEVSQKLALRDYAMLVRGVDRPRHFINVAAPISPFAAESLALYDEINRDQAAALAQGAAEPVALYAE